MTPGEDARFICSITPQLGYQGNEVTLKDIVSPLQVTALAELVESVLQSYRPGADALKTFKTPSMRCPSSDELAAWWTGITCTTSRVLCPSLCLASSLAICIATDITERQNLVDTLDWQTKNLRVISDLSLDAIFTLGQDDKIIAANPAAYTIFG